VVDIELAEAILVSDDFTVALVVATWEPLELLSGLIELVAIIELLALNVLSTLSDPWGVNVGKLEDTEESDAYPEIVFNCVIVGTDVNDPTEEPLAEVIALNVAKLDTIGLSDACPEDDIDTTGDIVYNPVTVVNGLDDIPPLIDVEPDDDIDLFGVTDELIEVVVLRDNSADAVIRVEIDVLPEDEIEPLTLTALDLLFTGLTLRIADLLLALVIDPDTDDDILDSSLIDSSAETDTDELDDGLRLDDTDPDAELLSCAEDEYELVSVPSFDIDDDAVRVLGTNVSVVVVVELLDAVTVCDTVLVGLADELIVGDELGVFEILGDAVEVILIIAEREINGLREWDELTDLVFDCVTDPLSVEQLVDVLDDVIDCEVVDEPLEVLELFNDPVWLEVDDIDRDSLPVFEFTGVSDIEIDIVGVTVPSGVDVIVVDVVAVTLCDFVYILEALEQALILGDLDDDIDRVPVTEFLIVLVIFVDALNDIALVRVLVARELDVNDLLLTLVTLLDAVAVELLVGALETDEVAEDVVVLLIVEVLVPTTELVDVFDFVPVAEFVKLTRIVLLIGAERVIDAELDDVLDPLADTVSDGLALDDLETDDDLVPVPLEVELLVILDDPVLVLEEVLVLVDVLLPVFVFDAKLDNDINGLDVEVWEANDDRVTLCDAVTVLVEVDDIVDISDCAEDLVDVVVRVDVFDEVEDNEGNALTISRFL